MRFRFTYSSVGMADFVATDPGGWDTASIGLERDPKLLSLVEFFKSNFTAYGTNGQPVLYDNTRNIDGGRDWILQAEALNGCDAQINQLCEIDENDDNNWETFFNSVLSINEFTEIMKDSHLLNIVCSQQDFWAKFVKRFSTPVDLKSVLDLDGNAVAAVPSFTLPLPSQKIPKAYKATIDRNYVITNPENTAFPIFLFGFNNELLKEITQQSAIRGTVLPEDRSATAISPQSGVPGYWFFDDDGDLTINHLKITLSFQNAINDPNFHSSGQWILTDNEKTQIYTSEFDMYIQKNNEEPILFTKANRAIPNLFLRNDGVTENLNDSHVADFEISNLSFNISKNDFIRFYYKFNNTIFTAGEVRLFVWGNSGWSHDSGFDQVMFCKGGYVESPFSTIVVPKNKGKNCYGGLFDASLNIFPTTIDNDDGAGQAILQGNWWNIANNGNLGGVGVDNTMVIIAKVNNPTNSIADWTIQTLTPFENLENYGDTDFDVSFNTVFKDSSTDAFLSYDIIKGVIQRTCGAPFKSDYLGNPYTSDIYGAVGCGSNLASMLGLHIRGYSITDKPFQISAQDWFDGINPIHCLGIGYEDVGGITKIVCERAEHFFDDSNVSVNFLNIYDIKRSYEQDWQFNKLTFGNQKWESQAATGIGVPSGIDDPQSQRTWTDIFKFIGKELKQLSRFVTASLTIEQTRRVRFNKNSNYTYDNEVFAIKLHDSGGGSYVPETNQPFSTITNLLNSETRYNSDLTPARNFLRWAKYWSGCLQDYVGSAIKYASGVGNFKMTSTKTTSCDGDDTGNVVAENGDFVVGNDYLFFPMPLEINHKLDWTTYKYLRDHKNWAVTISQTSAVGMKAFIKSLEYIKAKGEIKMIVWPKGRYVIEKVESVATGEGTIPGIKYFEIPEFADEFA